MQKQLLKGLTIAYDISEEEKVNEISQFIQNHMFLFANHASGSVNDSINIREFEDLINKIIKSTIMDEEIKKYVESDDFIPSLYLSYLVLMKKQVGSSLIENPKDMNIEMIYFFLSLKYYNYDIEKISKALLSNTFDEYDKMISQIKNEHRINIYNYILRSFVNHLGEDDISTVEYLELAIQKIKQEYDHYIKKLKSKDGKLNSLKELTSEEFDNLFIDFLNYINAPQEWFELYFHLRDNNLIIFEYDKEMDTGSVRRETRDSDWKIRIISDGTIRTFISFIHEFIHYVSLSQNKKIRVSIRELPSIYYEIVASNFLKEKGYAKEIVDSTLNRRFLTNYELLMNQIKNLLDIIDFEKNGPTSLEKQVKLFNQIPLPDDDSELRDIILKVFKSDTRKIVCDTIDKQIDDFSKSSSLIINSYQHLIGCLLAYSVLDQVDRKSSNKIMIDVTNQLGNHSIDSIIKLFGINLSDDQNSEGENSFQKTFPFNTNNNNN